MAFCGSCGTQIQDGVRFCPNCGADVTRAQQAGGYNAGYTGSSYNTNQDIQANKGLAVLSYISILFLVPLFAAKDSPYARFHANQGLVLCIVEIGYGIVAAILTSILSITPVIGVLMGIVLNLLPLAFVALAIIGIINAVQGNMKPLPFIGDITIIK